MLVPRNICRYDVFFIDRSGWGDDYIAGIDCQWIDVTGLSEPILGNLSVLANPQMFLCEGQEQYNLYD